MPLNRTASSLVSRIRDTTLRSALFAPTGDLISLAIGEPDFVTPPPIVDAMKQALDIGHTRYTDPLGLPELRAAIAAQLGRGVGMDNVTVTHGASAALAALILSTVNPGDTVVIEDPTYSLYADLAAAAGGTCVRVPRSPEGDINEEDLGTALESAALLIICQPANPTGRVLAIEEWKLIADLTRTSGTIVLSDEAYAGILHVADFISVLDVHELRNRAVLCQTFSKKFAMTGWRLGYLCGPADLIADAAMVHRTINGPLNSAVQHAATAALDDPATQAARTMSDTYRQRRAIMAAALSKLPHLTFEPPDGGFYFYCAYDDSRSSTEIAERAREQGVLIRPGREFGPSGEGHLRLSFATSTDNIVEGIERLGRVFTASRRPVRSVGHE